MEQMDDGQSSCSDDDSVSLLRDLTACHVTSATVDMTTHSGSHCPIKYAQNNTVRNPKDVNTHQKEESCRTKQCEADFEESAEFGKVCKPLKTLNQRTLHKRDSTGETLLHKACKKSSLAEVRMLIQAGISVNTEDYAGWTALHEAAAMGHVTVVKELLKAGANINARCGGVTPLHDAVCAGHYQVVKMLLESGSNPSDRNAGGISALGMTENEEMKELLLTFTAAPAKEEGTHRNHQTASDAVSSGPCHADPNHQRVREPGEGPNNLHLMNIIAPNLSISVGIRVTLEKLMGKQREMSAWPLTGINSVDRFQEAFMQIQSVLKDILAKQRLEKDSLYKRFQKVSYSFQHHVLRTHLLSLASCQKTLVEVLQKQLHLEETFVVAKTALQGPPLTDQCSSVARERMGHTTGEFSKDQDGEQDERGRPLSCLLTRGRKAPPHHGLQWDRTSICQKTQPPETFLQQVKMKGQNVLMQSRAKDSSKPLCLLIQGGALAPGSALQLLWKGKHHLSYVLADGSMMSEGKIFQAPECWLAWIIGNNIPVGSAYALDKACHESSSFFLNAVNFRDVPLSQLLLNLVAEKNTSHSHPEDSSQHSMDVSAQPPHDAAGSLNILLNIRTIYLVGDDEFMPSTVMDHFWKQFVQKDFPESDDWNVVA